MMSVLKAGSRVGVRVGVFVAFVGLAVVATFNIGCSQAKRGAPSAKVDRGEVTQIVALSGTVKPKRETLVLAPYTGYLRRIYVSVGSVVKKGDPLVAFTSNLNEDEGAYPIRSAYAGLVSQILKSEGDYLVAGGNDVKILKLEDRSTMFVESDVPEADIVKIKASQTAKIRLNALPGTVFDGEIVQIFQSARDAENSWDRKGGAFPIRVRMLSPSSDVKSGLSGTVEIQVASKKEVLRLPQEYVLRENGKFFVYRGQAGSDRDKREVKIGLRTESFVEILGGLALGDEVVFPIEQSESEK